MISVKVINEILDNTELAIVCDTLNDAYKIKEGLMSNIDINKFFIEIEIEIDIEIEDT